METGSPSKSVKQKNRSQNFERTANPRFAREFARSPTKYSDRAIAGDSQHDGRAPSACSEPLSRNCPGQEQVAQPAVPTPLKGQSARYRNELTDVLFRGIALDQGSLDCLRIYEQQSLRRLEP